MSIPKRKMTTKEHRAELEEKLKDGVSTFICSERYKDLLNIWSKFRKYSPRNILLIAMQTQHYETPPTYIASYATWVNQFKRVPMRGTGIQIYCPCPITIYNDNDEEQEKFMYFRPGYVFDISKTSPMPGFEDQQVQFDIKELTAPVQNFETLLSAILAASPVPVSFEPISRTGIKGYYSPSENRIVVREGLPECQCLKTLLHELAHAILHSNTAAGEACNVPKDIKEIVAESIAYLCSGYLNIDTSSYSFEYISSWNSYSQDISKLFDSMSIIRDTTNAIYENILSNLNTTE